MTGNALWRCQHSSESWRLSGDDGATFPDFDAVVVATPAPQAVPLLAAVPELAARADSARLRPCHAVMVTFSEPLDADFGGAFVANSALAWVARNAGKPERPRRECWVLHSDAHWSEGHLDDAPEAVAEALLAAFARALDRALPSTSFQIAHRWLYARSARSLETASIWDAERCIGACGDWLHGDRVEDAFTSGAHLARTMLGK